MAIRVQIPAPLRAATGGAAEVAVEAADVAALIEGLEAQHKGLKDRLCDASGELRSYVRIFVNDEDIRFLEDKATALKPGDVVSIVPAIAGGLGQAVTGPGRARA
jgi:molybdopterin synthase sulfur carrier subunit